MPGAGRRILAVALNTYREAVRARILLGLVGLSLATALYSIAIGEFALKNSSRVVADLGAASISIYAILAAIILGATSLYRELEQKTLFPILARPIGRAEYLVGKYTGTLLTLGVFIALDAGATLLILARHGGQSWGVVVGARRGADRRSLAHRLALTARANLLADPLGSRALGGCRVSRFGGSRRSPRRARSELTRVPRGDDRQRHRLGVFGVLVAVPVGDVHRRRVHRRARSRHLGAASTARLR